MSIKEDVNRINKFLDNLSPNDLSEMLDRNGYGIVGVEEKESLLELKRNGSFIVVKRWRNQEIGAISILNGEILFEPRDKFISLREIGELKNIMERFEKEEI